MKCEIFRNGNKVMGPVVYNAQVVKDFLGRHGCNNASTPKTLTRMFSVATFTIKPVREVKPNLTVGQKYVGFNSRESAGEIIHDYIVGNKTLDEIRIEHLRRLSELHNAHERNGLIHRGVVIASDIEARVNAKATLDLFNSGAVTNVNWRGRELPPTNSVMGLEEKTPPASIPVTSVEEMTGLYNAIADHLSKGFAARSAVEDMVAQLTEANASLFSPYVKFKELVESL
jgi:hypothetical protein